MNRDALSRSHPQASAHREVVAVIPARGGSKGIPGKNLREVGGRSLLRRAIDAARAAEAIGLVVVSTDDELIAKEARTHGAMVVARPVSLAGDEASSESALLQALEALAEQGVHYDVMAFLQCTSPFTMPADVDAVVKAVVNDGADAAFSAVPFHGFLWRPVSDGNVVGLNHDHSARQRRQERPLEYLETGAVYAMQVEGFRRAGHRFFGTVVAVPTDPARSIEIDTPEDLALALAVAGGLPSPFESLTHPPKLVVLDFDGVFTDNRVLIDEDGREAIVCHRGDGHGLSRLARVVEVVVLSTEANPVVGRRCAKLGLTCVQNLGDAKADALRDLVQQRCVALEDVLFVGNDVNDLECMALVGTPVSVADGVAEARAAASFVLGRPGGHGALRELSDLLLPLYQPSQREV